MYPLAALRQINKENMLTPEDRIILQLESDVGRLTLERDELRDELQILKQMIKDVRRS